MRGTAGVLRAAIVAACLLAACATRTSRGRGADGGSPQPVRIWVAPILWWEGDAAREVDVAIENATNRTVAIAAPDPANARVAIFSGPESVRVCGVEPREPAPAPGERVELAPGDRVAVRVSLADACAGAPPGDYRYEVSYRAPSLRPAAPGPGEEAAAESRARAFSGTLATRYGELVVAPRGRSGGDFASGAGRAP